MDTKFCQSCGMPVDSDEAKGTNSDGSKSNDYCSYCYENGEFTQDMSMDEMIEINLKYIGEYNKTSGQDMSVDEARKQLLLFMPTLKRWSKQ